MVGAPEVSELVFEPGAIAIRPQLLQPAMGGLAHRECPTSLEGQKGVTTDAQQAVISAQADLAQRQAELRQQQLVSEVVKPAQAEAERVRILAVADAERTRIQAEAASSNNRVALNQMLISQLPQIVKEAAGGLAGANVSVLNGADGLGEIAAGLVSQGLTILEAVRKGIPNPENLSSGNGASPRRLPQTPATPGSPADGHSG